MTAMSIFYNVSFSLNTIIETLLGKNMYISEALESEICHIKT